MSFNPSFLLKKIKIPNELSHMLASWMAKIQPFVMVGVVGSLAFSANLIGLGLF